MKQLCLSVLVLASLSSLPCCQGTEPDDKKPCDPQGRGECDDRVSCTFDSCVDGLCENEPRHGYCGTPLMCLPDLHPDCSDGTWCTGCVEKPCEEDDECRIEELCSGQEACLDGYCGPTAHACDDGVDCTRDLCDPTSGQEVCTSYPLGDRCEDNQVCDLELGCIP